MTKARAAGAFSMHGSLDLILTLTACLFAALGLGYVTHRIGLSPLVGYLLAGVVLGPFTPGFVADAGYAEQFAEIGVVLLMFGVGLHFRVEDLMAVRRIAIPGAILQSAVATGLAALMGAAFSWGWAPGLVFGLAISVASTVVLTRVLSDHRALHTTVGHAAVGWLIVEDLLTVVILVVLPQAFGPEASRGAANFVVALGWAGAKLAFLVVFTLAVGGRVIPWILARVAATHSRELFTLTVLTVALGIAVGAAAWFEVSMALGAFLAGMVVARSEFSLRAASEALPLRDAFAVLFFVAAGMLFDPRFLAQSPGIVLGTVAIIVVGKPLAAVLLLRATGHPLAFALPLGVSLGQIGEFSFILAFVGRQLGILPDAAVSAIVVGAIFSIAVNPVLFGLALRYRRARRARVDAAARRADELRPTASKALLTLAARRRAVVVGYGPVGSTLTRLLRENDVEPRVVELNIETARRLKAEGMEVVYGDAERIETLESAGVREAPTLVLSSSSLEAPEEVIRAARALNPHIRVLARCAYLRDRDRLRAAGADEVFSGEGEVALAMSESVLRGLGATPEQIDRGRESVRRELFGDEPR